MAESEEVGSSAVPQVASNEQTAERPVKFQSDVVLAGVVGYLDVRHAVSLLTVLSRRDPEEGRLEKHVIPFDRALVDQVTARAWAARQGHFAAAIPISRLEWTHFGGVERRITASLLGDMHNLVANLPLVFSPSDDVSKNRMVYERVGMEWYSRATRKSAENLRFTICDPIDGQGKALFEMKTGSCALQVPAQSYSTPYGAPNWTLLCCSHCHGPLGTDFDSRMCPSKSCPSTCVCPDCFQADEGVSAGPSYNWRHGAQGCAGCAFECNMCGDRKPLGRKSGCAGRYCHNDFPEDTCIDCVRATLPVDMLMGAGQCFECREVYCGDCLDECEHPGCGNKFCRQGRCQEQLFQCTLCNTFRCNHARDGGFHMEMLDCSSCRDMRCYTCELVYCDNECYTNQCCYDCSLTEMPTGSCRNCR